MEHSTRNTAEAQEVAVSPFLQLRVRRHPWEEEIMSYSEREALGRGVSGKITKHSLAQSTRAGT